MAMVKENLRVNPSVATVPRTAVNDARVGNIEVPKGTSVVCAMQAVRAPLPPFPPFLHHHSCTPVWIVLTTDKIAQAASRAITIN